MNVDLYGCESPIKGLQLDPKLEKLQWRINFILYNIKLKNRDVLLLAMKADSGEDGPCANQTEQLPLFPIMRITYH
jgi:hypothetical protein